MGLIYTDIDLSNPRDDTLSPLTVSALVDTGSMSLCVPEHVAVQLDLNELERREVTTAEGRYVLVPYVGPVRVKFANRSATRARWCSATASCWGPFRLRTWICS